MINTQKELLSVCDLFGDQNANITKSGSGNIEIFNRNMVSIQEAGVKMRVFQQNSNTLNLGVIGNKHRFFHIDGGHSCQEVLSDLNVAAASIVERGVIALDDIFRHEWPAVTEALIRFLDDNPHFCPIIVGFNKLILTRKSYTDIYLKEIRQEERRQTYGLGYPWLIKELPFNGWPLQIFFIPTYVPKSRLFYRPIKFYRDHSLARIPILRPFAEIAKAIMRRIKFGS